MQTTRVNTPPRSVDVNIFRANAIVCVTLLVVCCSLAHRESAKYPVIASYSTVGAEHGQCYCAMRFILDEYARARGNWRWIYRMRAHTISLSQVDLGVAMHRYTVCEMGPGPQQLTPDGGAALSWGNGGDHL